MSDPISRFHVQMSVDVVIHNYNFKVTSIIQIDKTGSNVSIFDGKLERSATLGWRPQDEIKVLSLATASQL